MQESKRSNFGERTDQRDSEASSSFEEPKSIHSMSTAEWRSKYEKEGTIDLWLEEEFNSGSRLVVCSRIRACVHSLAHLQGGP